MVLLIGTIKKLYGKCCEKVAVFVVTVCAFLRLRDCDGRGWRSVSMAQNSPGGTVERDSVDVVVAFANAGGSEGGLYEYRRG